jgi:hypothetical protein
MVLVGNERVGLEHGFEPLASVASLVPDCGEIFEVAGDLPFVPGDQDRVDVREVLVQPVSSAICDIVSDRSPCSATSAAVVLRVASRTVRRCASIDSLHSFGTIPVYVASDVEDTLFDCKHTVS